MNDLKYGFRVLMQKPLFTLVAILTLALGIGANTAIFSIINEVILRPLPYPSPEKLLRIRGGVSGMDLRDLNERTKNIQASAGYRPSYFTYVPGPVPIRIEGSLVTGHLFPILGVKPSMGRYIVPEDDRSGAPKIVVISHGFWKSYLGGKKDVVGSGISITGQNYTIVGVMPAGFRLPQIESDLWAPFTVESTEEAEARGAHSLYGISRMKNSATIQQVQSELVGISKELERLYPEENTDRKIVVFQLHEYMTRKARPALFLLLGAVLIVLIIAGSNVAGLLLARAANRTKEMAIRTALGAGRSRLVKQLLSEYFILSVAGGGLGLVLALWISELVIKLNPGTIVRLEEITLDSNVLIFTSLVSILSGLVFGLIPAVQASRGDVFSLLKDGSRTAGRKGHHRFRSIMVVSELMLALVLLVGGGLLLRSFHSLLNVDPGFNSENVITMNFALPPDRYREIPKRTLLLDQLEERIQAIPGVELVGMNNVLPFGDSALLHSMSFEGREMTPGTEPEIGSRTINPGYFKAMQIPLISGRDFNSKDRAESPQVGVVNQAFARKHYPNQNPVGKRVKWARLPDSQWMTIVGVVGDVRVYDLMQEEDPAIYTPYSQETSWWKTWTNLVIRTKTDQSAIVAAAKREMAQIDPLVPLEDIRTMEDWIARSVADRKFQLILLGAFSALAFFLAVLGLYGVISYLVSERTQDFGVRMALGAQPMDILKLVLGQAMKLAAAGVAAGIVLSLVLTRLIKSMLVGVQAFDPITIGSVAAVLVVVALAASYFPARRATKVDPISALRYE